MTEEEAGTKWCPHMFPYVKGARPSEQGGHNIMTEPDTGEVWFDTTVCIGSRCMMWQESKHSTSLYMGWTIEQWGVVRDEYEFINRPLALEIGIDERNIMRLWWKKTNMVEPKPSKISGYCGLARR